MGSLPVLDCYDLEYIDELLQWRDIDPLPGPDWVLQGTW